MIPVIIIVVFVFAIALRSETHALGLWLSMLITHGFLVEWIGPAAQHLPMYCGLFLIAISVSRGKWTLMPAENWIFLFFFIASITLAALFGIDPSHSITSLVKYSKGFFLAVFIAGFVRDADQVRVVTLYGVAAVCFGASIALYQHFAGAYTIDVGEVQRAGGLSGDPNDAALLMLTGLPLALYWLIRSDNRFARVMFAGVFVIVIAGITLTQSRGGAVALALILLFLFLRRPSIKVFSAGVVLVAVGLLFVSADYWERLQSLGAIGSDSEYGSINIRFRYIEAGIDNFLRNPVFGVGMGNFGQSLVLYESGFGDWTGHVAHNMYLEFFVENGAIAGLLFLTLLGTIVVRSIRYDGYTQSENTAYGLGFCVSMSLMAVMIAGLFLSQGKSSVLWFFVGLGLALSGMMKSAGATQISTSHEIPTHRLAETRDHTS